MGGGKYPVGDGSSAPAWSGRAILRCPGRHCGGGAGPPWSAETPSGESVVLTRDDGLSNPTSVALHGSTVYVTSAAFTTQQDPNLLLARLDRHR